jgi:hypothetical protein
MTYQEWLAGSLRLQLHYIATERTRYLKAAALKAEARNAPPSDPRRADEAGRPYVEAMSALGLHPLTGAEIAARLRQLGEMEADAPVTQGDNVAYQALYRDGEANGWAGMRKALTEIGE